MKKPLPTISVSEWLAAETELKDSLLPPQPKGSVTAVQHAALTGHTPDRAQQILRRMVAAGLITRQKWGRSYVYFIAPKKGKKK